MSRPAKIAGCRVALTRKTSTALTMARPLGDIGPSSASMRRSSARHDGAGEDWSPPLASSPAALPASVSPATVGAPPSPAARRIGASSRSRYAGGVTTTSPGGRQHDDSIVAAGSRALARARVPLAVRSPALDAPVDPVCGGARAFDRSRIGSPPSPRWWRTARSVTVWSAGFGVDTRNASKSSYSPSPVPSSRSRRSGETHQEPVDDRGKWRRLQSIEPHEQRESPVFGAELTKEFADARSGVIIVVCRVGSTARARAARSSRVASVRTFGVTACA